MSGDSIRNGSSIRSARGVMEWKASSGANSKFVRIGAVLEDAELNQVLVSDLQKVEVEVSK